MNYILSLYYYMIKRITTWTSYHLFRYWKDVREERAQINNDKVFVMLNYEKKNGISLIILLIKE